MACRAISFGFGLVIYGAANACKIVAQPYGPWSVLASVWTTLLVWNLLIARLALKEQITIPKALGSLIILCGAVLCVVGTPPQAGCDAGVKTTFSSCEFASLLSAPAAAVWLALLLLCVLASIPTILFFERRYPLSRSGSQTREASPDIIAGNELMPVGVDDVQVAARKPAAAIEVSSACSSQPPRRLDALMAVVYPCSLGLDEGVADLLIKGWSAMLAQCSGPQHLGCSHPILWTSMLGWVLAAFGSAFWWMRKVFRRYETTVALPVEYGSLNAANVCTGLLFYAEHERMSGEQIALILCGLCVILVGIGVGTLSCRGASGEAPANLGCDAFRRRLEKRERNNRFGPPMRTRSDLMHCRRVSHEPSIHSLMQRTQRSKAIPAGFWAPGAAKRSSSESRSDSSESRSTSDTEALDGEPSAKRVRPRASR